jgi:hypothetical protein
VRSASLLLFPALFAAACSSTPSASSTEPLGQSAVVDTATPRASEASTTAPPAMSSEPESTEPGGPLTTKVVEVEASKDGSKDMHVSISFDNAGAGNCHVKSYTLTWPGGTKTVKPEDFTVHGKKAAQRVMVIHPDDGKLDSLTLDKSAATTKSDCP